MRNKLAYDAISRILPQLSDNYTLLIGDQNKEEERLDKIPIQNNIIHYTLPYDCGLAYARNYLVEQAHLMEIPYCLLIADSIHFMQVYDFRPIISFLEESGNRGLVGFELEKKKCKWEYYMEVTKLGIKFIESHDVVEYNGINLLKCDICSNVFLAKTKTLLNLWDNEQKLAEHELAFLEYKKRGYEVFWTDYITFKRYSPQSEEYGLYRKRWKTYKDMAKRKLGIAGWIILPKH
jgi:hypothetical protein